MLEEKIKETKEIIEAIRRNYKNPIIYSGMGKDSLCLVHLCNRDMKLNWPIMFHRDPYFPIKYRFANKVIEEWNLVCWDYPASRTSVFYLHDTFEVCRHYQALAGEMALVALLYRPESFVEGEYLCALKDIYEQPLGVRAYPWDVGIQAHKKTECKPHSGGKPNRLLWVAKHFIGGADWMQPLREWTEEDVYQYHIENNIPINTDVYEIKEDKLVPKDDPTYNPDRRPACFDCMLPGKEPAVFCHKMGCLTNRLWDQLVKIAMPSDFPDYHPGDEENG